MPTFSSPIVCPFCPLHCDDVRVTAEGAVDVDCDRAQAGFAAAFGSATARLAGHPCSWDQAWRHVEVLVGGVDSVRVVTGGTDLTSAKQLADLQAAGQIQLAIETTATGRAALTALRRDGLLSATQGAVRRHADLIWSIGDFSSLPRIWQRLIDPARAAHHVAMPGGMTAEQTANVSDALRSGDLSRLPTDEAQLCESILASDHVAVVLGSGAWPGGDAMAAATMLNQLVMWLSARRRAVLLWLDPAATNRAVALWRTNQTLSDYPDANRKPEQRPAPQGNRVSAAARPEQALSTEALSDPPPHNSLSEVVIRLGDPPGPEVPPVQVQIGGTDRGPEAAEVFLPAAVVGVQRRGVIIRGDGSVTLPLQQIGPSEWPSAAETLWSVLGNRIC